MLSWFRFRPGKKPKDTIGGTPKEAKPFQIGGPVELGELEYWVFSRGWTIKPYLYAYRSRMLDTVKYNVSWLLCSPVGYTPRVEHPIASGVMSRFLAKTEEI